jgi:glyoxylase I family protein
VPTDYDHAPWQQQAGSTAFAPFSTDTTYFGNAREESGRNQWQN